MEETSKCLKAVFGCGIESELDQSGLCVNEVSLET